MRRLLTAMIGLYRYWMSPFLGNSCRFHPSCSEYAQEAITLHGVLKGCYLGVRRLLRCHPWHPGGVDPVPPQSGLRLSVGVDCGTETTSNPEQHKCG